MAFRAAKEADPICDVLKGGSPAQWVKAQAQFRRRPPLHPFISRDERKTSIRSARSVAQSISERAEHPIEHARWEQLRGHLYAHREQLFSGVRKSDIPWTFEDWLRGGVYRFSEKSRPKLAILERQLGIAEGTFLSHSRTPKPAYKIDLTGKAKSCLYRAPLPHELPARIKAITNQYFMHKTDPAPALHRSLPWTANFKGEYATRQTFEATLKAYWNFATRPKRPLTEPTAGLGLDPDQVQFIDLYRSSFLIAFLRWHFARTGKVSLGAITTYCGPYRSMLHGKHGWITQQPKRFCAELKRSAIPEKTDPLWDDTAGPGRFQKWAARQLDEVSLFRGSLGLNSAAAASVRIRDSYERIDEILRMPQPLTALMDLVRDHEAHQRQIIFINDRFRINYETRTFLLAAMACVPLRALTWTGLKLGAHVFKRGERWVFRIDRELFKNRRFLQQRFYEVTLPRWVTPYFDRYVREVRPQTLGAKAGSAYLLPVNSTAMGNPLGPVTPSAIQNSIRSATRQHWLAEINPHAWRHICATGILKADPENIVLAATVLNDAPKTIVKAYSHILPNDAFKEFANLSDRLARRGNKKTP